eukprot:7891443-Pyramimonas_sp.AAC.1
MEISVLVGLCWLSFREEEAAAGQGRVGEEAADEETAGEDGGGGENRASHHGWHTSTGGRGAHSRVQPFPSRIWRGCMTG